MRFFGIHAPDIGIDLGTSNVRVYVKGKGIVIDEPSLLVVRGDASREVLAVGEDARLLLGRTPGDIRTVRPVRDGVIVDFEMSEIMLHYFIRKAVGAHYILRPRVVISVPCAISTVERRAVDEAVRMAGARAIQVVEHPLAAALGTGLPVYEPEGSLVVDIGGGTSEIAVISLGGLVVSRSLRVGGDKMDEAISAMFKKEHNMLIGDRAAEDLKLDLGGALVRTDDTRRAMVRGRDMVTSLPMTVEITAQKISEALEGPIGEIVGAIKWVLERTPPELAGDIMRSGIYLMGGLAQLPDLDRLIASEIGISVSVARNPAQSVILGAGHLADNIELLDSIGKGDAMRD